MTATASDEDIERCRQLWIAIATTALQDLKRRVTATGKRINLDGESSAIRARDQEIRQARDYVYSKDFRLICSMAGVSYKPEAVMRWMENPGAVDDGTMGAVFDLIREGMSRYEASARVGLNSRNVGAHMKKSGITVEGLREAAQ